jgi:hypothetical protein
MMEVRKQVGVGAVFVSGAVFVFARDLAKKWRATPMLKVLMFSVYKL